MEFCCKDSQYNDQYGTDTNVYGDIEMVPKEEAYHRSDNRSCCIKVFVENVGFFIGHNVANDTAAYAGNNPYEKQKEDAVAAGELLGGLDSDYRKDA